MQGEVNHAEGKSAAWHLAPGVPPRPAVKPTAMTTANRQQRGGIHRNNRSAVDRFLDQGSRFRDANSRYGRQLPPSHVLRKMVLIPKPPEQEKGNVGVDRHCSGGASSSASASVSASQSQAHQKSTLEGRAKPADLNKTQHPIFMKQSGAALYNYVNEGPFGGAQGCVPSVVEDPFGAQGYVPSLSLLHQVVQSVSEQVLRSVLGYSTHYGGKYSEGTWAAHAGDCADYAADYSKGMRGKDCDVLDFSDLPHQDLQFMARDILHFAAQ